MKVAVVGSRTLSLDLTRYIPPEADCILSGGAKGIDQAAESYARSHGLRLKIFAPEYARYGRGAPFVRNRAMVEEADLVVAIWDGIYRGTQYTVDYAKKQGKPVKIYLV